MSVQRGLNMLSAAYRLGHEQQIRALLTQVSNKEITMAQLERTKKALEKEYQLAFKRIEDNDLSGTERKWIFDQNRAKIKSNIATTLSAAESAIARAPLAKQFAAQAKAQAARAASKPTWTVTDPRTGKISEFTSRAEAKTFSENISQQMAAAWRSASRDERMRMQEVASQSPQRMALANMVSGGLVTSAKKDGGETYRLKGSVNDLSQSEILLARAAGFDIPTGVTGKKEDKRGPVLKAVQHAIGVIGSAWEGIFTSVTGPISETAEKSAKHSIDAALKGKPVEGFTAYAVGATLRAAGAAVDIVTFPVRPQSWADTAEAVSLMLMPEKGETQAEYKSRLSDMVKNDVYDPKQREQMEKLLISTMPPISTSSEDRQAAKAFRKALAESIMADPVGFLAEVAGGYVGAQLLGSAAGRLSSKVKMELSQADRLEILMKQPWSGGMAASQESAWWLNQVVDDLVDNLNPDKTLGRKWKSLTYSQRFDKSMASLRARAPGVDVNPWALALATPGAYAAIRDGLRDKGLTDAQIDRLLIDVTRAEEMTLSGVGPVVVYESPEAVAEFSGTKPSIKPIEIQAPDIKPLEIQVPDITLSQQQIEIQEVVPEIHTEVTETPKPEPKKLEKPEEPTKPDEPGKPKIPPIVPKKKGDPGSRPNVFHALIGGIKEEYRVKFDYPKGPSETFTVTARSFPQALTQAQGLRRIKRWVPSEVDIAKTRTHTKK